MIKYFLHLIYNDYTVLDLKGCVFSSPDVAINEANLMIKYFSFEEQVMCKPAPRHIAIVQKGSPNKFIAIKNAA
ncbi:hypothetical protein DSM25559_1866 [Agrobacterium rosae]|uniref:Uncharacterized protein n=1 Tax=Agrobacterium rosae TaxID=1972867 RepID=A0A1R3TRJ5_9HYPH|nr:hypothetical protein DSM25559_1866 [Agrobacterium rosae]